jgi:hypothetical protein
VADPFLNRFGQFGNAGANTADGVVMGNSKNHGQYFRQCYENAPPNLGCGVQNWGTKVFATAPELPAMERWLLQYPGPVGQKN